jgi:hypothetical protein
LIEDNSVLGCDRAGIVFFCDQDNSSDANIQCWDLSRNVLAENGSHGLLLDFGDGQGGGNGAYLHVRATSNMIVDNGLSGVLISDADYVQGFCMLTNTTISGNGEYGIELESSDDPAWLFAVQNNIVWENTSGSVSGWDPATDGIFTNNDWYGLFASPSCTPDTDDNVDIDPQFVDPDNGDYHLDPSETCLIDKGTNSPLSESGQNFELDFEGQRRKVNGQADIGADEAG